MREDKEINIVVRTPPEELSGPTVKIEVIEADITNPSVDAIVNAANSKLMSGGGVCGAIHKRAGYLLAEECAQIGHCNVGDAVVTGSYDIPGTNWIIHAVGPIYGRNSGEDAELLSSTYRAVLRRCVNYKIVSVAAPCISIGIYGYPKPDAAKIAVNTVRQWEGQYPQVFTFCCFSAEDFSIYRELIDIVISN